ncbi:MAG: AI-2E family transporter, partial [Lachnospiraceae bacterium]|nr:AI-2E family transporter [Lachnospiraceae bacterium]
MDMILKYRKEMVTGVMLALLLFLFLKYIFPLLSPFLLAYLTVYAFYPLLYKLEVKWKIRKTITMFLVLGILAIIILSLIWVIIAISGGSVEETLPHVLEWKDRLFLTSGNAILHDLLPEILKNTVSYIQKVFPVLAYIGIYLIATILMAKDFDGLMSKVHKIGALDSFMDIVGKILRTAGMYLKAQMILIIIIMGICIAGFYCIGITSPILLGILAGILDALPFIGTGIVLIPTSLIFFLEREIMKGVICLFIYIVCIGVR